MSILTKLQKKILNTISKAHLLRDNFYLTGGTALSEFYLQHRYSEDLDFFTFNMPNIIPALGEFQKALDEQGLSYVIKRAFSTFAEVFVEQEGEVLKIDFAVDSPYRIKDTIFNENHSCYVDNIVDISCNKLSALFDRADPKDFVDIYFIISENLMPLKELISQTKRKHVGLDEYWLARAFFSVKDVSFLPKMIKNVSLDELKSFFLNAAEKLME